MRGPHHNFVVIAPMIMKLGIGVKLEVFYTMVTKTFMTSLLLRHYEVMTCILADAEAKLSDARNSQTDFAEIRYLEIFWEAFPNINSDFTFENF